jgi:chorismate mutase
MQKRIYAIRGAINAKNTEDSITTAVKHLFQELYSKNNLVEEDIVSIQFTITKDLTELNPAAALRRSGFGTDTALFCATEPDVKNAIPSIIRVLITTYLEQKPINCYLGTASMLRPEFAIKS